METNKIERNYFKQNFLKEIIIRLDFQGVLQAEMEEILMKVKPYLKTKKFNRYEQKIKSKVYSESNNGWREENNPLGEQYGNNIAHLFTNEDNGYMINLSATYICLKVKTNKYIPFEEYAVTFMDVANIYNDSIDFFTVQRLGLRKNNFCFFTKKDVINHYFKDKYFDYFENTNIFSSEKRATFGIEEYKMNLLYGIEQGKLKDNVVYKTILDLDIYLDDIKVIEKTIFEDRDMSQLNDKLFNVYVDALTPQFRSMLSREDTIWAEEIIGVDKNE